MLTALVLIIAFLLLSVVVLVVLVIRISASRQACKCELKYFMNFVNDIYHVPSEIEGFEVLYHFIRRLCKPEKVSLFYRIDGSTDSSGWREAGSECSPACAIGTGNCPLARQGHDCMHHDFMDAGMCNCSPRGQGEGVFMCISLADTGYPQGILQIALRNEHSLKPQTISNIKCYIDIAKPIIRSKRTLSALSKKASTDKLTRLYNRNFLDPYLENQIEAANLSGQQLSVIMIDLDNYKKINDSLGHTTGDHVLSHFAEIISKCVRKSDIAARYGGDEFLVVLPATSTQTAQRIAEKIRLTLLDIHIPPHDGIHIPAVSCSLGISTYPVHCSDRVSLLKTSDIALYHAKASGKNCSRVYGE